MNRVNLGGSMSNGAASSSSNGGSSPMNGPPKDAVSVGKKYRTSSRQSSSQRHHRKSGKYSEYAENSTGQQQLLQQQQQRPQLGTTSMNMTASPDQNNTNGGFFPQIANPSGQKKSMSGGYGNSSNGNNGNNTNGNNSPLKESNYSSANGITIDEYQYASVTSIKGLKPGNPNWTNQDNFFMMENFDTRDTRIYCVLDGHGEFGHLVSRRCREHFPHFVISNNLKMEIAFNMMHNDLNASEIDVRCSGATCVLTCLQGNKITVYNCGDSRAVLGRRNSAGAIQAVQLSNDHKPDKPEERKRIIAAGGHLGCRQVLVNQGNRGPVSMPVGPCRVWYQHRGETLGLAMSRSLGDAIVHKFGVSAEPDPMEHMIDDHDDFLLIATDGIWDVVENNQAVQLIYNYINRYHQQQAGLGQQGGGNNHDWSALEASNHLVKYARGRWEKLSPMIDDITCIVVKLHPLSR